VTDDPDHHRHEHEVQPVGAIELAVVVDRGGRQRNRRDEQPGKEGDAAHPLHRADRRGGPGTPVDEVVTGERQHRPDAQRDAHRGAPNLRVAAQDRYGDTDHADGRPSHVPGRGPLPQPAAGDEQDDTRLERLDDGEDGHRRVLQRGEHECQVDAEEHAR